MLGLDPIAGTPIAALEGSQFENSVLLLGDSTLAAVADLQLDVEAELLGDSTLAAVADLQLDVEAELLGDSTLAAVVSQQTLTTVVELVSASALFVESYRGAAVFATLSGDSVLSADFNFLAGDILLEGLGTLQAFAYQGWGGFAVLAGNGALQVYATRRVGSRGPTPNPTRPGVGLVQNKVVQGPGPTNNAIAGGFFEEVD